MAKNKYIETPDKMWELFLSYQEQTKNNPKLVHDFVGKDGNSVYREKEIPLTLEGFENYVSDIPEMPMDLGHYFANTDKAYDDYRTICSRIRRKIRQDQIEGGMSSVFNSSITQRLNNLVDKQESTVKVEQPLFTDE
jgi:hypothetical protein